MRCDCHIHMALDGKNWREALARHKDAPDEGEIRRTLEQYCALGFTFLRDGGDRWGVGELAARLAPEYGLCYRTPCFPIYRDGHYGAFLGRSYETLTEFRALVEEVRGRGGHFIKLILSGLMDFQHYGVTTDTPMTADEVCALTDIAHEAGFAVMAHANGDAAVQAAVKAGVDSVEHGGYLSEETLRQMAARGTVWVPTLATIGNLIGMERFPDTVLRRLLAYQMQAAARAAALGVKIAPGSDAGAYAVPHGKGGLDEYCWLRQALGEDAEQVLARGAAAIQDRF